MTLFSVDGSAGGYDAMRQTHPADELAKYIDLIEDFAVGNISSEEFERHYLDVFKNDSYRFSEEVFVELNRLFCDVDAYCENLELRDEGDLDGAQLRESALRTLAALGETSQYP